MSRSTVYVTDVLQNPDIEVDVLKDLADVVTLGCRGAGRLPACVEQADALIVFHEVQIGADQLKQLRRCKAIVRCGVGYDNVDGAAAAEVGIPLCIVPDYGVDEVADHAIGLMLAVVRKLAFMDRLLKVQQEPWGHEPLGSVYRLTGRTLGIVGLGRIGTATALRAKAFGMRVVFYDPYVPDGKDKSIGVTRLEGLTELLGQSDVVSLHCYLSPETYHIIGPKQLAAMNPRAYLVNTARGAVVDTEALYPALTAGQIAGAALDVLEQEPPDMSHPLLAAWQKGTLPNLLITAHTAFYSDQGYVEMRTKAAQEVRRVLEGKPPRNCVNAADLKT